MPGSAVGELDRGGEDTRFIHAPPSHRPKRSLPGAFGAGVPAQPPAATRKWAWMAVTPRIAPRRVVADSRIPLDSLPASFRHRLSPAATLSSFTGDKGPRAVRTGRRACQGRR